MGSAAITREIDVLLVEDSPHDADLAFRALKKHDIPLGHRIVVARDGAEALDLVFPESDGEGERQAARPKLVLLDLKLPKVGGLEVLQRLKGDQRTRFIPVVAFTSSKEERDVIESYQLGVNSYVVKPLDADAFARAVVDVAKYWLSLNHPPHVAT
jgi:two-component system, response regulator